jgi:DNA polymerase III epsilon subunit family exonuclease
MLPSEAFLQTLNKKQQYAVKSPQQPVIVLAGPGTGKTRVLVARIVYLIEHLNIKANNILALTFTNKAADEMKNRLYDLNEEQGKKITAGTIHGFALNILRKYHDRIGLSKHFAVCDGEYQMRLVKNICMPFIKENLDSKVKSILNAFSNYIIKGKPLSVFTRERYHEYIRHLTKHNLVDFDHIIVKTRDLLQSQPDVLQAYQQLYQAILVDEFQDTDKIQYDILKRLAYEHRHIFFVADDDQSIYAWRGACPENIRQCMVDFNIGTPIFLEENYRNGSRILSSANAVIQATERIIPNKKLRVREEKKNDIEACFFLTEKRETDYITQRIRAWHDQGIPYCEMAVIYPVHKTGQVLEQIFLKEQIPYQMATGRTLLENPLVYKLIAYLRLIRDPEDDLALEEMSRIELESFLFSMIKQRSLKSKISFRKALYDFYRFGDHRITVESKIRIKNFIAHIANLVNLKNFYHFNKFIDEIYSMADQQKSSFLIRMQSNLEDLSSIGQIVSIDPIEFSDGKVTLTHPHEQIRFIAAHMIESVIGCKVNQEQNARMSLFVNGMEIPLHNLVSERRKGSLSILFKFLQWYAVQQDRELMDYVVLDIETTDQDIERCGIVEFAAVRVRNNVIVDRITSIIKPNRAISKGAYKIHRIDEQEVKDAPTIEAYWPTLKKFIAQDIIIAHNGYGFDFPILDRFARAIEGEKLINVKLDSLVLARTLYPDHSNSIDALMERFGVQCDKRHRALQDVEVLAEIYRQLRIQRLSMNGKIALEMYLDYVALGNYLENRCSATEDRIFFIGGSRKLGSLYSKILSHYCSRFMCDETSYRKKINERLEHMQPQSSSYQEYEQHMLKVKNITGLFASQPIDEAIENFLSYIALSRPQDNLEEINAVSLLTYYAAKGLEFDKIFLVGLENENMPNFFSLHKSSDDDRSVSQKMEEQKRLFYVGLTRAKTEVILTVVKNRGGWERESSPFLKGLNIPFKVVE